MQKQAFKQMAVYFIVCLLSCFIFNQYIRSLATYTMCIAVVSIAALVAYYFIERRQRNKGLEIRVLPM